MTGIEVRRLTESEIDMTKEAIKSFGLNFEGGSFTNGVLHIGVKNWGATFNEERIAQLLMTLFCVNTIILNGFIHKRHV